MSGWHSLCQMDFTTDLIRATVITFLSVGKIVLVMSILHFITLLAVSAHLLWHTAFVSIKALGSTVVKHLSSLENGWMNEA